MATPQSILKIKRLMTAQTPPPAASDEVAKVLDLSAEGGVVTEDEEEEDDDDDHENWLTGGKAKKRPASRLLDEVRAREASLSGSRESTPTKSLRFHVPKAYPPEEMTRDDERIREELDKVGGNAGEREKGEDKLEELAEKEAGELDESGTSYRTIESPGDKVQSP